MKKVIEQSIKEIQRKRNPSYTKGTDVKRVIEAMKTDDWSKVYQSRLYKLHGGEYCELQSVIHKYL